MLSTELEINKTKMNTRAATVATETVTPTMSTQIKGMFQSLLVDMVPGKRTSQRSSLNVMNSLSVDTKETRTTFGEEETGGHRDIYVIVKDTEPI